MRRSRWSVRLRPPIQICVRVRRPVAPLSLMCMLVLCALTQTAAMSTPAAATSAPAAASAGPFFGLHTRPKRNTGGAAAAVAAREEKAEAAANKRQRTAQHAAAAAAAARDTSINLTADDESDADAAAPPSSVRSKKKKPTVAERVLAAQKHDAAAKAKRAAKIITTAKKIKQQQIEAMKRAKSASQKKNNKAKAPASSSAESSSDSEAESSDSASSSSSEPDSESAAASKKKHKASKAKSAAKPAAKDNVKRCRYCSRALGGRGISAAGAAAHLAACKKRTPAEREAYNRAAQQRSHAQKIKRAGAWGGDASDDESSSSSSDDDDSKGGRKRKRSKSLKRRVRGGPSLSAEGLMKQVGYDLAGVTKKTKSPVFEVEAVRDRRFNPKTLQYEYLIKWCEFSEDENTWEPAATTHCRELIHQFHLREEEQLTEQIDDAVEKAHRDPREVAFHRDGLCTLTKKSETLPAKEVAATEEMVSKLFNATLRSITNRDLLDVLESRGFDNFKLRQRGRYDLTLDPATLPFLPRAPWLPAVKAILGGTAKLQHVGCMMSLPSSETQPWHSDGPHRNKDCHLPAYMANVFMSVETARRAVLDSVVSFSPRLLLLTLALSVVLLLLSVCRPLIDMSRSLGGTQFQPGSHVHHDFHIRTTSVTPILKAGQSLIFDYRIRHRGLANSDTIARPLLYFTYSASDAIVDDANFAKGRYKPLPALIPELEETREERMKKRLEKRGKGGAGDSDKEQGGEEGEHKQGAAAASAASSSPMADADAEEPESPSAGEHKEAPRARGRGRPRKSVAATADAASSSAAAASSSSAAAADPADSSSSSSAAAASPMADDGAAAAASDNGEQKRGGRGDAKQTKPKQAEEKSRPKSKRRGSAGTARLMEDDEAQGERKNASDEATDATSAQAMQLD